VDYVRLDRGERGDADSRPSSIPSSAQGSPSTVNRSPSRNEQSSLLDAEIESLKAERERLEDRLEEKNRLTQRTLERDALRRECLHLKGIDDSSEQTIRAHGIEFPNAAEHLPSCTPSSREPTSHPSAAQTSGYNNDNHGNNSAGITIRELRGLTQLSNDAEAQLSRYGIDYEAATTTERHNVPTNNTPMNNSANGKNNNNISVNTSVLAKNTEYPRQGVISGREIRPRDIVLHQLHWPHTFLDYSFASSDVTYSRLDPALLAAGELTIILDAEPVEKEARTKLLRKVLYYSRRYTWQATKSFHETVLSEIERGHRSWADKDFRDIESAVLFGNPLTSQPTAQASNYTRNSQQRQTNRRFFCLDYNRSKCQQTGPHEAQVGALTQTVEHMCSSCWRRSRTVSAHPESAPDCPQRK